MHSYCAYQKYKILMLQKNVGKMNLLTEYRGAISWWFEYNPDWENASVPYSGRIWNKFRKRKLSDKEMYSYAVSREAPRHGCQEILTLAVKVASIQYEPKPW